MNAQDAIKKVLADQKKHHWPISVETYACMSQDQKDSRKRDLLFKALIAGGTDQETAEVVAWQFNPKIDLWQDAVHRELEGPL